jgi:hypothetical protein
VRRNESDDSMELLLDTICNVFGGVLFLALLVCLLTQNAAQSMSNQLPSDELLSMRVEQRKAELRLQEAQQQLATMQAQQGHLTQLLASLGKSSDPEVAEAYSALVVELSALSQQRERVAAEVAEASERLRKAEADEHAAKKEHDAAVARRDATTADAERQLAEAREAAEAEREKQTVQLRLPRARVTGKQEVALFISQGRLFMPLTYDRNGWPTGRDAKVTTSVGLNESIGPADLRIAAGIPVEANGQALATLDRQLSRLDPAVHFVTLAVWPDSYKQFRELREHVVKKRFEYRLLLMGTGESVGFGDSIPQVQ